MNVRRINISQIKPAGYNPRKNLRPKDKEYQKIKRSIENFGFVQPLIVNTDGTCIGGHQRLKVLKELGYREVECVVVNLTKEKEKALNLALNKVQGEWDMDLLEELINDIQKTAPDLDLTITGFDAEETEAITGKRQKTLEELVTKLDVDRTISEPAWVTIRTSILKRDVLDRAISMIQVADPQAKIVTSYSSIGRENLEIEDGGPEDE